MDARALVEVLAQAIIVTDPAGFIRLWNVQAERLYGWSAEEVIGSRVAEVLVPLSEVEDATPIRGDAADVDAWEGDVTVSHRDGSRLRIWVRYSPVLDADGNVVAIVRASEDVTERRRMELQNSALTEHLRLAIEAGEFGTFRWDMATGATEWDAKLESLFGLEEGQFDGTFDAWLASIHPDDREHVLGVLDAAVAAKVGYNVKHRVVWPDGTVRWIHGAGRPTMALSGEVTGAIGCTRDITEEVLAEAERQRLTAQAVAAAEQEHIHGERLEFLSGVNEALATARDHHEVMVNVAHAAVPRLGDWCSMYVFTDPGATTPEVYTAHVDPAMVSYARELQAQFPHDPDSPVGIPRVIRTRAPEFHPVIAETLLREADPSDEVLEVVNDLRLTSAIAVPLVKHDRVLGAIQFVMTDARRRYTDDDFTLAQAISARVASSLENHRLVAQQRAIAAALQASLLPREIPVIPGLEIAVRYWANGEAVEVGGDFYDVFALDENSWAVVIGDVCGTGPDAAGVTGLARHTIATSAWQGNDPTRVLQDLNHAMRARRLDTFCTAIYGTVTTDDAGTTFACASAGHPLPMLVTADGQVRTLGRPGRLAGVFDDIDPPLASVALADGDALVLYTDGATDVAPPYGLTDADLQVIVARSAAATTTADGLANALHRELSDILPISERHDDIALLILRKARSGS